MNEISQCITRGFSQLKYSYKKKYFNIKKLKNMLDTYYNVSLFLSPDHKKVINNLKLREKKLTNNINIFHQKTIAKKKAGDKEKAIIFLKKKIQLSKELKSVQRRQLTIKRRAVRKRLLVKNKIKNHLQLLGCPIKNNNILHDKKDEILQNVNNALLYYNTKLKQTFGETIENKRPCFTNCENKSFCDRVFRCKRGYYCSNEMNEEVQCSNNNNVLSELSDNERKIVNKLEYNLKQQQNKIQEQNRNNHDVLTDLEIEQYNPDPRIQNFFRKLRQQNIEYKKKMEEDYIIQESDMQRYL